jgi:hypothetical protein
MVGCQTFVQALLFYLGQRSPSYDEGAAPITTTIKQAGDQASDVPSRTGVQLGVQAALDAPDTGEQTLFSPMRLQVRGVDHDPLRLAPLGQRGEDLVEHAQPAPADGAVVDRLVGGHTPWARHANEARR